MLTGKLLRPIQSSSIYPSKEKQNNTKTQFAYWATPYNRAGAGNFSVLRSIYRNAELRYRKQLN
jgi:hypothetical protein